MYNDSHSPSCSHHSSYTKAGQHTRRLTAAILLAGVLALPATSSAWAERNHTVITAPGVKYESEKGWFGKEKKVYKDAMGNQYTKSRGVFGQTQEDHNLFGFKAKKNNSQTLVTTPGGRPIYEQKRGWFGKKETHIDGNGILNGLQNQLNQAGNAASQLNLPGNLEP